MKNILFLNVLYKPNIGGVENSISELIKVYINKGYSVKVFCSNRNNENEKNLPFYEKGDYEIIRYEYSMGFIFQFFSRFGVFRSLFRLKKKCTYDLIISRSYYLTFLSFVVGFRNICYIPPEVSFFLDMKGKYRSFSFVKCIQYLIQIFSLFVSNRVFVFSDSMVDQVSKITFGIVRPRKVNPGVDFFRYAVPDSHHQVALRKKYNIPLNKKVILALGRFSPIKQYDLAILSMLYLDSNYLLLLVGSGPELSKYKEIVDCNSLHDKVIFFPSTNTAQDFYQLSDYFYMTSAYESFGQTVLEALSCGLKVIAFNRAAGVDTNFESMLPDSSLILYVDKQCPRKLASTIEKNDEYTLDCFSIKEINRKYSWDSLANQLEI